MPFKRAGLTADVILIHKDKILLIKRKGPPDPMNPNEPGKWAIPGGFHEYGERMEETAVREVFEETGIKISEEKLRLVGVYSDPERDKREHIITVCYQAELESTTSPKAGDDAGEAKWFKIKNIPTFLAFDHEKILKDALNMHRPQRKL